MRCMVESFIRDARGPRGDVRLSRIHAVETNPHPDPPLLRRERGSFGGTVSGSPNRDPRRVRPPLPARSGERIKLRGASDCILTAQVRLKANSNARPVLT